MKYLGESFTVHGGGGDLVFPHHEAEIAQSECLTGPLLRPALDAHGYALLRRAQDEQVPREHGLPRRLAARLPTRCHPPLPPRPPLPKAVEPRQTRPRRRPYGRPKAHTNSQRREAIAGKDEIKHHGGSFLEAMSDDLDTPRAIDELRKLAESGEPEMRRVATDAWRSGPGPAFRDELDLCRLPLPAPLPRGTALGGRPTAAGPGSAPSPALPLLR